MAFQYRRPSDEEMERHANQHGKAFNGFITEGMPQWRAREGENHIRVLPGTWHKPDGSYGGHFAMPVYVHYDVGIDKARVLCPEAMLHEPCPICAERRRTGDDDDEDTKPGKHQLMWIIDRNDERKGPQVWAAPFTMDQKITKASKDRETGGYRYPDDPDKGYDIFFDKTGTGKVGTKYGDAALAREPSPLGRYADQWLEYIEAHPLDQILVWRDYEEIAALFRGEAGPSRPARNGEDRRSQYKTPRDDAEVEEAPDKEGRPEPPRNAHRATPMRPESVDVEVPWEAKETPQRPAEAQNGPSERISMREVRQKMLRKGP